jgi:hypothetical protein
MHALAGTLVEPLLTVNRLFLEHIVLTSASIGTDGAVPPAQGHQGVQQKGNLT